MKEHMSWTRWLVYESLDEATQRHGDNSTWIECQGYFVLEEAVIKITRSIDEDDAPGGQTTDAALGKSGNEKTPRKREATRPQRHLEDEFNPRPEQRRLLDVNAEVPNDDANHRSLGSDKSEHVIPPREVALEEVNDLRSDKGTVEGGTRSDHFVHTSPDHGCDPMWTSWPTIHDNAVASGTVIVFNLFPSIGNVFIVLHRLMKVVRILQVGLVLGWKGFPGFRAAFDPAAVDWDLDAAGLERRAIDIRKGIKPGGLQAFTFKDGSMILSYSQMEQLARWLHVEGSNSSEMATAVRREAPIAIKELVRPISRRLGSPPPCAWNMLFRRSALMMANLAATNPWGPGNIRPTQYVAWHIRSSAGESKTSYKPDVHTYIFDQQPSTTVCPLFVAAMKDVEVACRAAFPRGIHGLPVYISSNSKRMSSNCSTHAISLGIEAGHVDLGLPNSDAHTRISKQPQATAVNAFIDYLFLMDATMIVRTGSSFSGMVSTAKHLSCVRTLRTAIMPVKSMSVCLPKACS